ncbi:MAG: glycosyltransferase family 4 protein [Nitrososphaerales archaeon]
MRIEDLLEEREKATPTGLIDLKIAQVNVYFKPFMVGGAEWYVYNISRRLVKLGHEVHVYTVDTYNHEKQMAEEEIEGILVHRLPLRIDWSYRLKVWKGLKEALMQGSFDIIHTYDYPQWHSRVALKAARESHAGSALTVFDIHSMIPRARYKQLPMKLFEKIFAKSILNSADKVLVRAPTLLSPLESLGVNRERMEVTPSGINDESLGYFDGKRFRDKFKIDGSPLLLCLSRLNPLKGPQNLLKAAPGIIEKYPEAIFVFVGPDQSGYINYLKSLARDLGIENKVFFTGAIYDFQEKMETYASCDIFALPTTYEGTSQAIFEAMSQSRPIVATEVGGIPSQIENGKEGMLIPTGDDSALGKAILKLLDNPSLARQLGLNAKSKVEHFRYSVLTTDLVVIYEALKKESRA